MKKGERDIANPKNAEEYDFLKDDDVTYLSKNRKKENEKNDKMQRCESKMTVDSKRSEGERKRSNSRPIAEEAKKDDLKILSCRSNVDIR